MTNNLQIKKNILVLGGFGFIGRNLVEEMVSDDNYEIIIFDRNISNNREKIENFGNKIYLGDFNNEADLEKVFSENKIDIVIHLISSTTPANIGGDNIVFDIETNLIPTVKLLNLMNKYQVKKIVFASSGGTVYGLTSNEAECKNSEDLLCNPICSHGIVKLSIEKYLQLYKFLYGIDFLILRIANPFGLYHYNDKQGLINVVLRNIIKKDPVTIWGDGEIVRDFIYIKDCVRIIKKIIDVGVVNEIINIGRGKGYSVNYIFSIIKKIVGEFEIKHEEQRNFDVPCSILNIDKLNSIVNYQFTSLEEAIRETYEWTKNVL